MERLFLMVISTVMTAAIAWGVDSRPVICGNAPISQIDGGTVFRLTRPFGLPGKAEATLFRSPDGTKVCTMRVRTSSSGDGIAAPGTYLYERPVSVGTTGTGLARLRSPSGDLLSLDCQGEITVQELKTKLAPGIDIAVTLLPDDQLQCRSEGLASPSPSVSPSPSAVNSRLIKDVTLPAPKSPSTDGRAGSHEAD